VVVDIANVQMRDAGWTVLVDVDCLTLSSGSGGEVKAEVADAILKDVEMRFSDAREGPRISLAAGDLLRAMVRASAIWGARCGAVHHQLQKLFIS
jgi:predicted hydrolase (HD superfamily)